MPYCDVNTGVIASFKFSPNAIYGEAAELFELVRQTRSTQFIRNLDFTDAQMRVFHDRVLGIHQRLDKVLAR